VVFYQLQVWQLELQPLVTLEPIILATLAGLWLHNCFINGEYVSVALKQTEKADIEDVKIKN
jgi:hypothetical protein